jgi:hypothetical protein
MTATRLTGSHDFDVEKFAGFTRAQRLFCIVGRESRARKSAARNPEKLVGV